MTLYLLVLSNVFLYIVYIHFNWLGHLKQINTEETKTKPKKNNNHISNCPRIYLFLCVPVSFFLPSSPFSLCSIFVSILLLIPLLLPLLLLPLLCYTFYVRIADSAPFPISFLFICVLFFFCFVSIGCFVYQFRINFWFNPFYKVIQFVLNLLMLETVSEFLFSFSVRFHFVILSSLIRNLVWYFFVAKNKSQ